MSSARLPVGGRIDRSRALSFSFNGQRFSGHPGDTLASALLANNQWLLARSFKYHRPRGPLSADATEPNALVTVGSGARTEPNVRATVLELHDGLSARSQNCWPSVRFDVGAVNGLLSPLLRAGFYYKTFMWPAAFWEKVYEPLIRRAAGLGVASTEPDPDRYEQRWTHCDLLVIGAGPAGLAAALTAARAGVRVVLADERPHAGGDDDGSDADGQAFADRTDAQLAELRSMPNVRILLRTTVFGWYDSGVFGALERVQKHVASPQPTQPVERLWRIVSKAAIMATGAHERPLVFNGNDRPGVLLAGALHTYVTRYAVRPGQALAFLTNNDSVYRQATELLAAGVKVAAIIDRRQQLPAAAATLQQQGVRVLHDANVVATAGRTRLRSLTVAHGSAGQTGKTETIAIDTLGMAGGFNPVVHLSCQRGARPRWDDATKQFMPPRDKDGLYACGAAAGHTSFAACAQHGEQLAQQLLADSVISAKARIDAGGPAPVAPASDRAEGVTPAEPAAPPAWLCGGKPDKAFVDYQNDVTAADLLQAVQEGYGHVEMAKRYTTTGMATDQGKSGNINATGLLAQARRCSPGDIGTTTFRPFYTPISFGALAGQHRGEHYQPRRRSPLHEWAESLGAQFVQVGHWDRSAWFPRGGETAWRDSVNREVLTVRHALGLCDVSTLGKIELYGPDSADFLHRIYSNKFLKLPLHKARYGLMLREDGFILDDGTVSRLGEQHYLLTTTTGAAGQVMSHLEWCHQVLWPQMQVRFVSVSDQWAQMAVAGPRARDLLQMVTTEDLSEQAFPLLAAREVRLTNGLRARLFRISFSGELAYELAVPADHGNQVAAWLMRLGKPLGITAYGTEAMGVMRIEKGFVTHAEIDGRVTPADLGLHALAPTDKHYIGKRLLERSALQSADRPQLVGLIAEPGTSALRAGAHLLGHGQTPSMANDQGHVSSSCFSPTLGRPIALALLRNGRTRHGERITVWDGLADASAEVQVVDPGSMLATRAEPVTAAAAPDTDHDDRADAAAGPTPKRQPAIPAGSMQTGATPTAVWIEVTPPAPLMLTLTGSWSAHVVPNAPASEWPAHARPSRPGQILWLGEPMITSEPVLASLDQSHAHCVMTVSGPAAIDLLACGTGVDLAGMAIGPAGCCTTQLDGLTVVLTRLGSDYFELIVSRSYARALANALALWGQPWSAQFRTPGAPPTMP